MEALSHSITLLTISKNPFQITNHHTKFQCYPNKIKQTHFEKPILLYSSSSRHHLSFTPLLSTYKLASTATTDIAFISTETQNRHWMVLMEKPPPGISTKSQVLDYYVGVLQRVLGSEKDAQMCIYDASFDAHFGFCCDINEETSRELAGVPGVLSVRPDPNHSSEKKDYTMKNVQLRNISNSQIGRTSLFPVGSTKSWLVRVEKPGAGVVTKPQMVDYYARLLTKVLGNETDAQMCLYHISWQSNFGFCCEIDDECARQLAGVPGVLSVLPAENFDSEYKDYQGDRNPTVLPDSSEQSQAAPIKTKKLFITGLSFYTSEKTLRAAFDGFGEIVEVKIIMDKISKRSKGYAFIEYTTEEAASVALTEMNGKTIDQDTTGDVLHKHTEVSSLSDIVRKSDVMLEVEQTSQIPYIQRTALNKTDLKPVHFLDMLARGTLDLPELIPD